MRELGKHQPDVPWFIFGIWFGLVLNFFYLYVNPPTATKSDWRLFRLIGLWLDAKESELKARADRSKSITPD